MISLLKQYKRLLVWLISGLVITVLLSLATPDRQTATAFNQSKATAVSTQPSVNPEYPDFAATHLEPNFYQY
ncbi:hypothetical protein [Dendronalium sp. ChiSLP03b]|uniref:hypothetical protein n=1 Tax=Dendronalium sp. ChiSLP03b TaxID=3075381 RepID=UPI002AD57A46|nr:hypothetical protein [Dendronalium sp. ChiSLP03b]MDZ8204765.1 hypothetical protein [Dendronalium sp. ChiSLP03b]